MTQPAPQPAAQAVSQPHGVFVGLTVLDLVHHVVAPPAANQKVTALNQFLAAGGPAANAAVTFAALGGQARLITALGHCAQAQLARQDLEAHGVEVIDLAPPGFELSVSAVAVTRDTGDRAIVSLDGGLTPVPAAGIREHLLPTPVLLVDGHHPELALAALDHYAGTTTERIMDAGRWKPHFEELFPHVDTIISSADFAVPNEMPQLPTQQHDPLMCSALFGGTRFARTGGEQPIVWWERGPATHHSQTDNQQQSQIQQQGATQSYGTVSPPVVEAVDTLGAGDVFHGAYAYFAARSTAFNTALSPSQQQGSQPGGSGDRTFETCLRRASEVAAVRVANLGPRDWLNLVAAYGTQITARQTLENKTTRFK